MDLRIFKKIIFSIIAFAIFTLPISNGLGYTNLFLNPSFDSWTDDTLNDWDTHNLYAGDVIAKIDAGSAPSMVHNGTFSVQCALNGTDITHSNIYQFYTPTLGVTYTYSLWVLENNPNGAISIKATEFLNPTNVYYSANTQDSTSYQQINLSFVGTGTQFYFTIYLRNNQSIGETIYMYFDDAVLAEGTIQDISEGNLLFLLPIIAIFGFIIVKKKK